MVISFETFPLYNGSKYKTTNGNSNDIECRML
jgi:hypothetical protein